MNDINKLFFELIQVALGVRACLSHSPTAGEWTALYDMSKKQSLVGVCFAAVQRLQLQQQCPEEMLYLTWMGMAAKILQRNEVVNQQCVELQKQLAADGLHSCILKGQGVAQLYAVHLRSLRQSGDIDAWVNAPMEKVVAWAEKVGKSEPVGYLHVSCHVFDDTEVELHYRPSYSRCFWHNKRLQMFCECHKDDWTERNGIIVPSWEFDVVYHLSHIYRHLFGLGIGLRQLMDYYWILCNRPVLTGSEQCLKDENIVLHQTLKYLGLYDFAGAVMFVLREFFLIDEKYLFIPIDKDRGYLLLDLVLQTGNFGKMDSDQHKARKSSIGLLLYKCKQMWTMIKYYPAETVCTPLWLLRNSKFK